MTDSCLRRAEVVHFPFTDSARNEVKQHPQLDKSALCAILILREDYGEWLLEMDIKMCTHHDDKYSTERAIEKADNEKPGDWIQRELYGADCLVKKLQDLGFNEETAAMISLKFHNDFIDPQKSSFRALHFHPLFHNCPRYPENALTMDAWFDISLPISNSDEPSDALRNVRMINIASKKGQTLVKRFLEEGQKDTQRHLLYHTTNHPSAISILTKGIMLKKGKKNQDFSSCDGFYLSETFENASEWRKDCDEHQAIIVYSIDNNLLDASRQNLRDASRKIGWDITEDKIQWEKVIRFCRNGCQDNKQMMMDLQSCTFIRGAMCRNPRNLDVFPPRGFGDRNKIQVCIRDQNYAKNFGSLENIACVLFF